MKHLLLAACLLSLIVSCNKEETGKNKNKDLLAHADVPKESHKELYGLWTGMANSDYSDTATDEDGYFEENYERPTKITIKINRIINDSVFGLSIMRGKQTPVKGLLVTKNGQLSFKLNEPNKNKLGGKYELTISNDTLQGKWAIYKPTAETSSKKNLKLTQKAFSYNPNVMPDENYSIFIDWDNPVLKDFSYTSIEEKEVTYKRETYRMSSEEVYKLNASTTALTEESLKNFRKVDLEIIKNCIYARHGYAFKKNSFRNFFELNEWYVPLSDNVDKELTKLEKKNIALLQRMEEYAEDHYDTFGR